MARKPRKIRPDGGLVRISCLLEADIASKIDEEAARMTAEDKDRRMASRTDALRSLVLYGLEAKRGDKTRK